MWHPMTISDIARFTALALAASICVANALTVRAATAQAAAAPAPATTGTSPPSAPSLPGRSAFARTIGLSVGAGGAAITRGIRPEVQGGIADWFSSAESANRGTSSRKAASGGDATSKTRVMYPTPPPESGSMAGTADATGETAGSSIMADTDSEPVGGEAATTLFAGVAYEVRAVDANGTSTVVDSSTHLFRTGDRFMLLVRPSLPGQMEVFNINPSGKQNRIDAAQMAAGQLSTLGPYEFAAGPGDEALRLVFSACSSPALMAATRDIVKVSAALQPAAGGVQLGACGKSRTSSPVMHSISNVSMDGSTSFALDPVGSAEIASGVLSPREVMVVFHHQ